MLIDRTHRPWLIASLAILGATTLVYVPYAMESPRGARGSSVLGLLFGIVGFALIIFVALLGARKKVPIWRVGRAQTWMRGHLWLGLLSLPLILFHGGFHFGGRLTQVLMWLLIVTVASGVFGAALQHFLPRVMTDGVPMETIFDEISSVRAQLLEEADKYVEAFCGPLGIESDSSAKPADVKPKASPARAGVPAGTAELSAEEAAPLRGFYLQEIRPFLEHLAAKGLRLSDAAQSHRAFEHLHPLVPPAAHSLFEDLEDICEEARQLTRQERLHHWLYAWMLVHVPLSLALILLGAVHAVMALRY
jgi:hypothetical protein